uniref:Prostaglandin endoperoxide synthase n=1 Tax=Coccotylus truncatus TaxID=661323 RepID=I6VCP8_9FLOR|nr:prostaglandin endoperoxide synthase [Coccotylus truncatus]
MFFREFRDSIQRCGGFSSYFSMWLRSSWIFQPFWYIMQTLPWIRDRTNQLNISLAVKKFGSIVPRVPSLSLRHDYPCLGDVYDESRSIYSRVLPRNKKYTDSLPPVESVASLFMRDGIIPETNCNLTVLIAYYAQWVTHQFFNTDESDPTGHSVKQPVGVNMSMLYGSKQEVEKSVRAYKGGLLKSTIKNGQEFPEIMPCQEGSRIPGKEMFNMPILIANMIPGFAAIHVLFFRRHQYICRELAKWAEAQGKNIDDEELFQKAKLIVTVNMLRITMHDYVSRALQSSHAKMRFDQKVKQSRIWKMFGPDYFPPSNAIQFEFNIFYRWHQFYPDTTKIMKRIPLNSRSQLKSLKAEIDRYDTDDLKFPKSKQQLDEKWNAVRWIADEPDGMERVLFSASSQRAGKLSLLNTNQWIVEHVVKPGLARCREHQLASYNDYREKVGFPRLTTFEQVTSNPALLEKLKRVYRNVDQIEYYPGVFAEDKHFGNVHGPLAGTFGSSMTFTGIFSSRLFETALDENALTPRGVELAGEIDHLDDMTRKHTRLGEARIRFTMPDDAPVPKEKSV